MDLETKVDLILKELKNIFGQIDERFEKIDEKFDKLENRFDNLEKRFDNLENRFDNLENRFDNLENRFDNLENRFDNLEKRFDNLEKRFDKFEEKNEAEHKSIYNMLYTLNSAFLRFESEQTEKINYLLEADQDRKDHQIIYAHEFTKLNDLVAKNSFRISNLEQHQ